MSMNNEELTQLIMEYFLLRGYQLEKDVFVEGKTGTIYKFDFVAKKENSALPIIVKNWNRTVGINVVIDADRAAEDTNMSKPILIGWRFSDHAKSYANRMGITLINISEIQKEVRP